MDEHGDARRYLPAYLATTTWVARVSGKSPADLARDAALRAVWRTWDLPTGVVTCYAVLCCLMKIGLSLPEEASGQEDFDKISQLGQRVLGPCVFIFHDVVCSTGLDVLLEREGRR